MFDVLVRVLASVACRRRHGPVAVQDGIETGTVETEPGT